MFEIDLRVLPGAFEGGGGCHIGSIDTIHTIVEGLNLIMNVGPTDLFYFLF
jgi:hypothetical protein